jgi:HPt (histidine-containing phosphotransfer) domain-containing protein
MEGDREACPAGSMDGHVSKPVRRHTLYAAIAEARQQPEDDAFQQQLLTLFPKEATESLSTIASALEPDDQVAISAAAHKLKGCAHLVAHSEITDRAAELEAAVREETTELAALCDALREATEGFLKS